MHLCNPSSSSPGNRQAAGQGDFASDKDNTDTAFFKRAFCMPPPDVIWVQRGRHHGMSDLLFCPGRFSFQLLASA